MGKTLTSASFGTLFRTVATLPTTFIRLSKGASGDICHDGFVRHRLQAGGKISERIPLCKESAWYYMMGAVLPPLKGVPSKLLFVSFFPADL